MCLEINPEQTNGDLNTSYVKIAIVMSQYYITAPRTSHTLRYYTYFRIENKNCHPHPSPSSRTLIKCDDDESCSQHLLVRQQQPHWWIFSSRSSTRLLFISAWDKTSFDLRRNHDQTESNEIYFEALYISRFLIWPAINSNN